MKIKEGFVLRQVCGESVVSAEGLGIMNFSKLVTLNATAKLLFEKALEGEFTLQTLVDTLKENFPSVEEERLTSDCEKLIAQWTEIGLVDE